MSEIRKRIEAEFGPEQPYDPDNAVLVGSEPICNCPLCGRTHRKMPFGKPPAAISDTVTVLRAQYEALMAAKRVLFNLHSYVDFKEPLTAAKPLVFDDPSGVNAEFEAAYAAIAALRASGIDLEEGK